MATGFIFHGLDGQGQPAEVAADKALSAAVPFVSFVQTGGAVEKALPDHLAGKADLGHTPAPDADYQVLNTDVQVGFSALTAPRTVTLPDVDTYPLGQVLFIADESGQCSASRKITVAVGGSTGDSIAGQPAIEIADAYQGIGLRRGAANVWIIAR